MIPRPPLTYTSPAQIVRLYKFGLRVPEPVYLFALSQLPPEPVIEYRTVAEDDGYYEAVDARAWQRAQNEYQDMLKE